MQIGFCPDDLVFPGSVILHVIIREEKVAKSCMERLSIHNRRFLSFFSFAHYFRMDINSNEMILFVGGY